jgi:hypothetical protein
MSTSDASAKIVTPDGAQTPRVVALVDPRIAKHSGTRADPPATLRLSGDGVPHRLAPDRGPRDDPLVRVRALRPSSSPAPHAVYTHLAKVHDR